MAVYIFYMIYIYTQHESTARLIETECGSVKRLSQDRARDPVEDIMVQLPADAVERGATLYAVLPPDRAIALKNKAPKLRVILLQLDGAVVERITGRPYDPKTEYGIDILRRALRAVEVRGGRVEYLSFSDLKRLLERRTVAVFNDILREALRRLIVNANFVKTCGDDVNCVEVNPLGVKKGLRISFPGTSGRLTAEQMMAELVADKARIYYLDVEAVETSLCR
jgi:hypothetical protein